MKRKLAATWSFEAFVEQAEKAGRRCFFWTLTTPDVCDSNALLGRWKALAGVLRYQFGCRMFRVVEPHPGGHGVHLHVLLDEYIPADLMRHYGQRYGFGRVNVKRVSRKGANKLGGYLAKYLAKSFGVQDGICPGCRRWACIGFKGCLVVNVECRSAMRDGWALCKDELIKRAGAGRLSPLLAWRVFSEVWAFTPAVLKPRFLSGQRSLKQLFAQYLDRFGARVEGGPISAGQQGLWHFGPWSVV